MKSLLLASTLVLSGLVQAQEFNDTARVISANPVYEQVNNPRRECWTEYRDTPREAPRRTSSRKATNIGGAIVGGVVGGLLGNQVGKGHGKEVATAGGAIAGAIVGNEIANNREDNRDDNRYDDYRYGDTYDRGVERCADKDQWERRLTGYEVRYEYRGQTYQTVMQRDPGPRLPVRVVMEVTPR